MSIAQIIGLVVVLLVAVFVGFLIVKKSKSYDLFKWLGLFFFVTVVLSWIFKGGYFAGTNFQSITEEANPIGFTDVYTIVTYGFQSVLPKAFFVLAVGAFYGVLSKTTSYRRLVSTIAKKIKGKEILFTIIVSLLFTIMGSMLTQSLVALVFVPFVVSIVLNTKLDKMTAFVTTIGSMLVGLMGATYGFEGISEFSYYLGMQAGKETSLNIVYQALIAVVAFLLLNFFNVRHAKKVLKEKNNNEENVDPFMVEKTTKKVSLIPSITILAIIFILVILGYINWNGSFGISCFEDFHNWLIGLSIGDFAVFSKIFGSSAMAFGAWDLTIMPIVLFLFALLAMLLDRMNFDNFITNMGEGIKVMLLPTLLLVGVQSMIYIANYSPTIPVIINAMIDGIKNFNPFIASLVALIGSIFQPDLGFNALTLAGYYVANYAEYASLVQNIFVMVYGLVGLCVPTSALLLIGLSYLNIDYKSWIKYIWIFILSLIVILLVLFTVLAYI